MMLVHDINENINKTLNKIFSYINSNLNLKKDFDDYCKAVGISKDNKNFNSYALNYIFERRLGENKKSIFDFAIESASDLSQEDINVINCLKNSIDGVFEVRKITKDKFELFNITNEKMYLAKPMAKMTKFSNLSIGHFIIAKLIIIENEYYIYHVVDHITYSNRVLAFQIAVTRLVQDPSLYYYDNEQKLEELKLSARILDVKFTNMFNSNYAVTSNKSVDILIAYLNEYIEKNIKPDDEIISSYIDPYKDNEYFEVSSLKGQGNVFAQAKRGFSSQKEKYNVALLADEKTGLQVVPFMDIFLDIFERDDYKSIKKYKECMSYFITSRQVPPLALEIAYNKFQDKFLLRVNEILGTQFTSIEEIFSKYKQFYLDNPYTTSTLTLYSSYAFIKLLEVTDEEENPKQVQKVGRNDLCPCGSGLKYKKCCGKTIQI